jgi:multidrug efflux system membrane fusion protein
MSSVERPSVHSHDQADPAEGLFSASSTGKRHRRWPWLVALSVVAVVAFLVLYRSLLGQSNSARAGKQTAPRAVPVVGVTARVGDLGVYQNGLGTVTPIKTVTVHSRVDGELDSVAYREGQLVREGDLLAQLDPRPFEVQLHQAAAQLAKDEATLKNARIDLERYKVLIAQDSIPRQQLDTQSATVDQDEAAIKSDQAQIESARLNLTYGRITAPISGIVGLRLVDPGNIVHASDQNGLLVITQQQPIAVIFTIAADHLQAVLQQRKAGQELVVEAWDRDFKHKLATGSLLAIDNQIDQSTGTVRMKAQFPNDDYALYPNQFVNARLLVDTLRQTVLVPTAAIQRSPQSTYVYVVKPDSTVELRTVDLQLTEGDDTSVRKGLSSGEVVVVDGMDKLQPGTLVVLAKSGGAPQRNP